MTDLFEGMWANDLEDMIQPIVSIDEYASKIDQSAIAIGFFASDRDAADDLNRFIQKSPVPILDSDVSPAPDMRGYYLVFAEIQGNERLVDNIITLCGEVGMLGAIDSWKMKMRGIGHITDLDPKKIEKCMIRNNLADRIAMLRQTLDELKSTRLK